MVASFACHHEKKGAGDHMQASSQSQQEQDREGVAAQAVAGKPSPVCFTEHGTDPIPVTYMVASADLMQRHKYFAAHLIEALQEQTPER